MQSRVGIVIGASIAAVILTLFAYLYNSNDCRKYLAELKGDNMMVKLEAIYYLGKEKEESAVPVLLELTDKSQPREIRLRAIEAMGRIGEKRATEKLIELIGDLDDETRRKAIEALGRVKDPKGVEVLSRILEDGSHKDDEDLQCVTVWALGNIGNNDAIPALTQALSSSSRFVKFNAMRALSNVGAAK